MSDPYASPFPDRDSGQHRAGGHSQYPDRYAEQYPEQYAEQSGQHYAGQYGQQYGQYPEQYPTRAQPVTQQPSTQQPSEHYSSQAYVTPQTPTRRSATQPSDSRPVKKAGTPLGRIVLGVFLGLLLWTVVLLLIGGVLLASVAGRLENRLQDLNSQIRTTSSHSSIV